MAQYLDDITLLLHHTHPDSSNGSEANVRGYDARNHQTDYIKMAEHLPEGSSFVATKSDHWERDPDFWDRLESDLERRSEGTNDSYERHRRHVTFEHDGVEAAVINGVEASLLSDNYHFTLIGGDLDEGGNYNDLTTQELYEEAEDFAFISPAHPHMIGFDTPDPLIEDFLRTTEDLDDVKPAMNFATGYTPTMNKIARGTHPALSRDRVPVQEYADRFGIDLIPEMDIHASFPAGLEGAGLLEDDIMDELRDGDLPVDRLTGTDVVSYGDPGDEGMSWRRFLNSYPDMANKFFGAYDRILKDTRFVPATDEEFQAVFKRNLQELEELPEDWNSHFKTNRYDPHSHFIQDRK